MESTSAKSLTDLPADAVCQVLLALDNPYDVAQTASASSLFLDAVIQAFVLRPHFAKVADLAKHVAQLKIENTEMQMKHLGINGDLLKLSLALGHALESEKARADEAEARCTKFSRELLNQQARAEKHKERAEKYKAQQRRLSRQEPDDLRRRGLRTAPIRLERPASSSDGYRHRQTLRGAPRSAPRLRSSMDRYDSDSSASSADFRPRAAPRRRTRAD